MFDHTDYYRERLTICAALSDIPAETYALLAGRCSIEKDVLMVMCDSPSQAFEMMKKTFRDLSGAARRTLDRADCSALPVTKVYYCHPSSHLGLGLIPIERMK